LMEAAISGAINPNYGDILAQFNTLIHFTFDFRKTISTNMEHLWVAATHVNVYDTLHTEAHMALQVLANIKEAQASKWCFDYSVVTLDPAEWEKAWLDGGEIKTGKYQPSPKARQNKGGSLL